MRRPAYLALKLALFLLFAVLAGLAILLPYQCPIRSFTGVICPGCGMGRAWLSAFHLDFRRALYYHPMFWIIPVFMLFGLYDFKLFGKRLFDILILSLLGVALAVTYILRLMAFLQGVYVI